MSPTEPGRPAAFFDVDYTVLDDNSGTLYVKFLRREGQAGGLELARTAYYVLLYKLNLLNFEKLAERETRKYAGRPESEMIEQCDRWFEEMVVGHIYPQARELIAAHQARGELVALLSAATVYLVRPLARHLGIEHYLCNRLEVDGEGFFTGRLLRPLCYGHGKIELAEKFAARHGVDLSRSAFYTDSITDLPVLLRFGEPVAVNPDPLLGKEARARGWKVIEFRPGS